MSRYDEVLPVLGPLYVPSSPSGVHFPGCDHQPPNECRKCNGEEAELRWRPEHDHDHVLPPCMRIPNVEEAS